MALRQVALDRICTPLVRAPLSRALPASLLVLPRLSEEHQTHSWVYVAWALASASALTAGSRWRDRHADCETSVPMSSATTGHLLRHPSIHSDFLHHLDCEGSVKGADKLPAQHDHDACLASRAFSILLARSAQPQTEQTSSPAELDQDRLLVAVQSMGMTHLREMEVYRLWKRFHKENKHHSARFGQLKLSHEEFLKVVARSSVLQSFVAQVIAREASMNFVVPAAFDYTKPTCDNYAYGPLDFSSSVFAEARKGGKKPRFRDYSYHNNYTSERQAWQDLIVEMTTQRHNPQPRPWIVFSCGAMGCGKGYAFEYMSQSGHFPLEKIVRIDPDFFKQCMPEWDGYVSGGHEAGSMTHKESGFIQELCQEVALQRRQNIWVDGSLRDADWFEKVFDDVRERYPHYRIGIFNVHASEEKVRERVAKREKETGRGVPDELLEQSFKAPPLTLFTLGPKTDWVIRVENETTPTLVDFANHDHTRNWTLVKSRFGKVSPEPHEFPFSMAPIALEVLGPRAIACPDKESVGPLALVGISNSNTGMIAREHMGIPKDAQYFGWVSDNSLCFPHGGFLFYDEHKQPIGGARVAGHGTDHECFMEFRGRETHQDIPSTLRDTKRWAQVSLPDLMQGGAKEYAFVLPGERGMNGLGGFTYKMEDGSYLSFEIRVPSSF